jgi:hypothetical protein
MWGRVTLCLVRAADIRRWVEQRRLAARREEDEERGNPPPPEEAFARGLRMIALAAQLHGWPLPEDDSTRQQDLEAYARWARLRVRLRR